MRKTPDPRFSGGKDAARVPDKRICRMKEINRDGSDRREAKPFGQLVSEASARSTSVIEPLDFSIVTVGVLTPFGVVPVVTVQRFAKADVSTEDHKLAA